MEDLNISVEWLSPRKEDEIYRTIENLRSDMLGICFSFLGEEEIDENISRDEKTNIIFKNSIINNTKNDVRNISVEDTIAILNKKKYPFFYIPDDIKKYIKTEIPDKLTLNEYEKHFPNNKYIYEIGKTFYDELLKLGFSSQAAYSCCGAFFVECGWNVNVYNKDEAASMSGTSSFAQGLKNCGEGLFGLTNWDQKYKIITALGLNNNCDLYGIDDSGKIDRSIKPTINRIPFKSNDIRKMGEEYDSQPSNLNPKLFMATEKVWIRIFNEFVNNLPRVTGDEKTYSEYFKYTDKPLYDDDPEDIDHQILYATYLFKAGPNTKKTFEDTVSVIERYKSTHEKMYGQKNKSESAYNTDENNKYKSKNGFVQQLLIAYLLSQYCNDVEVEKINLNDIFNKWGNLSTMNSEFLVNTYVATEIYTPLIIPKPNTEGITVLNHTEHMFKRTKKIEYIILHYTAGVRSDKGAAKSTVNTLDKRGYSSDFVVDDVTILQFADDPGKWASTAVQRWSTNGTEAGKYASNNNAVSIEICSTLDKGGKWVPNDPLFRFTDKTLGNVAFLCKKLIQTYNIPKEHIIRHYDIMGKRCPGIIGWNLGDGSNNENKYRSFVESLYNDTSLSVTPNSTNVVFVPYSDENKINDKITDQI